MNNIKAIIELQSVGKKVECSFNFPNTRQDYNDDESFLKDVADYVAYMVNSKAEEDGEGYGFTINPGDYIYMEALPGIKVLVLEGCKAMMECGNFFN